MEKGVDSHGSQKELERKGKSSRPNFELTPITNPLTILRYARLDSDSETDRETEEQPEQKSDFITCQGDHTIT